MSLSFQKNVPPVRTICLKRFSGELSGVADTTREKLQSGVADTTREKLQSGVADTTREKLQSGKRRQMLL
jgi:hypothetical protein